MKQTLSSEFGSGARKKQEFFRSLFDVSEDEPEFNKEAMGSMIGRGGRVLAAADAIMTN
jgi:hypothetical protein